MLFVKPDVRKTENSFSTVCFVDLLFTASNLIFDLGLNIYVQVKFRRICIESETICPEMLIFGK